MTLHQEWHAQPRLIPIGAAEKGQLIEVKL